MIPRANIMWKTGVTYLSMVFRSHIMSIIHFHEKSKMTTNMAAYGPDGKRFPLVNIKILKLDILRIKF